MSSAWVTTASVSVMAAFNVQKPGVKEFAIVIGGTLVLYLGYQWWKNRSGV